MRCAIASASEGEEAARKSRAVALIREQRFGEHDQHQHTLKLPLFCGGRRALGRGRCRRPCSLPGRRGLHGPLRRGHVVRGPQVLLPSPRHSQRKLVTGWSRPFMRP